MDRKYKNFGVSIGQNGRSLYNFSKKNIERLVNYKHLEGKNWRISHTKKFLNKRHKDIELQYIFNYRILWWTNKLSQTERGHDLIFNSIYQTRRNDAMAELSIIHHI